MKDYFARLDDVAHAMAELRPRLERSNVRLRERADNGDIYAVRLDGVKLSVIVEVEVHGLELWGHLSVCAQSPKRVPNWAELRWCKECFLGDRKAIQVLPPRAEYVNMHPHVLHLFAPLERDPLPDLRAVALTGPLAGQVSL